MSSLRDSRSSSPENDVFSMAACLVPERDNKSAGITQVDFDSLLEKPLLLHEDLKEGCGGQLWPAGMVLSKYMLQHHHDLKHQNLLEIGAGGGLVGLATARGCENVGRITITDQLPMLALMQKNILLNGLEGCVDAQIYDWGDEPPAFINENGYPNVILAADCVYFEPAFPLLLQTLQDLIQPQTTCYFCFKKRRKADMRFIREMTKKFRTERVDYDGVEKDHKDNIWLYVVRHKTSARETKNRIVDTRD